MATTGVNGVGGGTGGNAATKAGGFGALTSEEFVKVMLSELRNQDPFQPQDSSKLMEQMSSLRNIESQLQLQNTLTEMVDQNGSIMEAVAGQLQMATAGNLIGKTIKGLDAQGQETSGLVKSVVLKNNQIWLQLEGNKEVEMGKVMEIKSAA